MRNMALKRSWYFYLLMEKPLGCHFQVPSPYYQAAQCNWKAFILATGLFYTLCKGMERDRWYEMS